MQCLARAMDWSKLLVFRKSMQFNPKNCTEEASQ